MKKILSVFFILSLSLISVNHVYGSVEPTVILKVYPSNVTMPDGCDYTQKVICIFTEFNMTKLKVLLTNKQWNRRLFYPSGNINWLIHIVSNLSDNKWEQVGYGPR